MTNQDQRSSLLQMAKGAIQERVDYEVARVVDNLLDMNTEAKAKRKVTLTITMVADDDRRVVKVEASANPHWHLLPPLVHPWWLLLTATVK